METAYFMEISHDKFKNECSRFYRIGYKTAYRDAIGYLKGAHESVSSESVQKAIRKCIEGLVEYHNSFPCIDPIELRDIDESGRDRNTPTS